MINFYQPRSDVGCFPCRFMSVSVSDRQRDNPWNVWDVVVNFFWEQDMINNSDEFENGCIPMHCGARVMM